MLPETVILKDTPSGPSVNIEHKHIHHSPDGFNWGYHGSGPADLALNILALALPNTALHPTARDLHQALQDETGEIPASREEEYLQALQNLPIELHDGSRVNRTAYLLHQDFKRHFLAHLPEEGGQIPRVEIETWIAQQTRQES